MTLATASAADHSGILLLALQAFQVAFLWLHDWLPLPPLNDVAAVRAADTRSRLITTTLIQSLPFTWLLYETMNSLGRPFSASLTMWLWIGYGLLLLGQLRAWWVPYLLVPDAKRAARYDVMFGRTHAFLPRRNGIVPNTLHVLLHLVTFSTLLVLAFRSR